jgi:hypothetical protein
MTLHFRPPEEGLMAIPLPDARELSDEVLVRGVRSGTAAHNAVGLAGESPAVGIDCLPT